MSLCFLAKSKAFAFYNFGSDTFYCFYPLQVAVAQQLKELHTFTWSFDLGLGGFLGSWFDPLWLITGWFPDSWQLSLRLPMFVARMLVGGGFIYGYLRQTGFREPVAVVGGLGYAFSSCAMINAQWEAMQGTELMQLPALLFLLELYLHQRNRWAAVAAGIVVGIGHPLGLYMFALLTVAYACVRLGIQPPHERKHLVLAFLAFAAWCVVGVALTAPILFPALYYLFDSPRVSGDGSLLLLKSSLLSINDAWTIGSEIAGLLGKDLLGSNGQYAGWQNYFEGPGFYVGLLPLMCIPQLLGPRASARERTLFLIGISGVAAYFVWPALRHAVYGYGHQAFRFSMYWISVLLLVLGAAGLNRALESGWWRRGVMIGAGAILIIVLGTMLVAPGAVNVEHATRVIAFTCVYAAIAMLAAGDNRNINVYLLVAICACELVTFALPAVVEREAVGADGSSPVGRYDDGTKQALEFIRQTADDDEFFRIEKTYSSVFLDDALVQDYSGTASYTFHGSSLSRFVDLMGLPRPVPHPNYISSMATRPDVLSLLAVKYVLSRGQAPAGASKMIHLTKVGDVDVYLNGAAHTFATLYESVGSESEAGSLPIPERDATLLSRPVVENVADVSARLAALSAVSRSPGLERRTHVRKLRDDQLAGEISTPVASLLLFAMPFDRGWSATLDGEPLELFRADYGLTAALVPAGTHAIALDYVPPGRPLGIALATGVLAAFTVFGLLSGGLGRARMHWLRLRQSAGLRAATMRAAVSKIRPSRRFT